MDTELMRALEVFGYEEFADTYYRYIILDVFETAVKNNEFDANSLRTKYGMTTNDIKFLYENFPTLKINRRPSPFLIKQKISELKARLMKTSAGILQDMELWIFPKWRELIRAVYLGMFEKRPIKDISLSAIAILLPSQKDIRLYRLLSGEECFGIFGLGSYVVEFTPERAPNPTLYSLPIHGVLIEKAIYERAISSRKLIVAPQYAEYVREHLIRLPLDKLSSSKLAIRFFNMIIRRLLKILNGFLKAIRSYPRGLNLNDISILSAWRGAFNKILVTSDKFKNLSVDLLKGIPGVVGYEGILEKMDELTIVSDVDVFNKKAKLSWLRFAIAGFNLLEQFFV